jgi:hypothetical protein
MHASNMSMLTALSRREVAIMQKHISFFTQDYTISYPKKELESVDSIQPSVQKEEIFTTSI